MNDRLPWGKFSWSAYENDPGLALVSLGAQGLWMRMLCIAVKEGGYLRINSKAPSTADLAELVRTPLDIVEGYLTELEAREVFSRTSEGVIYSRRMIDDAKISRRNSKNGKKGGNPNLLNRSENSESLKPSAETPDKAEKNKRREEKNPPNPPGGQSPLFDDILDLKPFSKALEQAVERGGPEWALERWNEVAKRCDLPIAEKLTDTRRRALGARLKTEGFDRWDRALAAVEASKFCRGMCPPRTVGGTPFRATLDFVLQASSFQKLIEGAFGAELANTTGAQARRPRFNSDYDGPPKLRAAIVDLTSEQFAAGIVDRCHWREADQTFVAPVEFLAQRLQQEIGHQLKAWGIKVEFDARSAA